MTTARYSGIQTIVEEMAKKKGSSEGIPHELRVTINASSQLCKVSITQPVG
ncbi:MAG: hypothetical protein LPK80_03135 [Bacteroidota bacterium]|nr:hypothetical protein [Bacteroidota bacterium]